MHKNITFTTFHYNQFHINSPGSKINILRIRYTLVLSEGNSTYFMLLLKSSRFFALNDSLLLTPPGVSSLLDLSKELGVDSLSLSLIEPCRKSRFVRTSWVDSMYICLVSSSNSFVHSSCRNKLKLKFSLQIQDD